MVYEESSYNAQNVRSNKLWIGGWGIWENNMLNMLISTQKLYFCDDDAIYDDIMEKPVRKLRHSYRHEISRDSFVKLSVFYTYSTIFIFTHIDGANIAFRGLLALLHFQKEKYLFLKRYLYINFGEHLVLIDRDYFRSIFFSQ